MLSYEQTLDILLTLENYARNPERITIEAFTVSNHHVSSVTHFGKYTTIDAIDWVTDLGKETVPNPLFTICIK